MNYNKALYHLTVFVVLSLTHSTYAQTPVAENGQLKVHNTNIVNQHNELVSLAGPSFFWSNSGWSGDKYYNADVVKTVALNWNASIVRVSVGVEGSGGYIESPLANLQRAERVIQSAIEAGLYVIIDWHSHHAEDYEIQAMDFFAYMAGKYGNTPNIIYEIYNEPLNTTDWSTTVLPYAEKLIAAIRAIDPDNLIIVGTQTWSQDVDKVIEQPVTAARNILYALHFYAGTHKDSLRDRAQRAIDAGIPLFVTEWGSVNADGDGAIDYESSEKWLNFMRENNLSHCSWSLTDKKEGAAFLQPGTPINGQWTTDDLTENGRYLKRIISNWKTK